MSNIKSMLSGLYFILWAISPLVGLAYMLVGIIIQSIRPTIMFSSPTSFEWHTILMMIWLVWGTFHWICYLLSREDESPE